MKKIAWLLLMFITFLINTKNISAQSITIVHIKSGIYFEKGNDFTNIIPAGEYYLTNSANPILIQSLKKQLNGMI